MGVEVKVIIDVDALEVLRDDSTFSKNLYDAILKKICFPDNIINVGGASGCIRYNTVATIEEIIR